MDALLGRYIGKKLLLLIPTLLGILTISFVIVQLAPGNVIDFYLGQSAGELSPETLKILEKQLGLDKPIWEQYAKWIVNFFRGDLGYSFWGRAPVVDLLVPKMFNSFYLMITAQLLSISIAIPIGVIAAVKRNSRMDNFFRVVSLFGFSMPAFWQGIIFILVFAVWLHWLPPGGMYNPLLSPPTVINTLQDRLAHLILPAAVIGTSSAAYTSRLVRSSVLEILGEDYVRTARAYGFKESVVIFKYALRNALLPVVTIIGLQMAAIIGGAAITETVFSWPGMGRAIVNATYTRDLPLIMSITALIGLSVMLINLATDVLYSFLDPRIRY